jgi:hypothetical protein
VFVGFAKHWDCRQRQLGKDQRSEPLLENRFRWELPLGASFPQQVLSWGRLNWEKLNWASPNLAR